MCAARRRRGGTAARRQALAGVAVLIAACGPPRPAAAPVEPRPGSRGAVAPDSRAVAAPPENEVPSRSASPEIRVEPEEPHRIVVSDGRVFGATPLPIAGREVLRRSRSMDRSFDRSGPLPARVMRRLQPPIETLRVFGPSGACEPARGWGQVYSEGPDYYEVGERIGRCEPIPSIAFADGSPPEWLRYTRLAYRIHRLPASGETDDPRVRELLTADEAIEAEVGASDPSWATHLRRRFRVATVELGVESISFVETHWELDNNECPVQEGVTYGEFLRSSDGSPWERARGIGGQPVGVYHDGLRVLAVEVLGGGPRDGERCGDARASDCLAVGLVGRRDDGAFERVLTVWYGLTAGQYDPGNDYPPLLRDMDACGL